MKEVWTFLKVRFSEVTKNDIEQRRKEEDGKQLIIEIRRAFQQWQSAQLNFHEITGKDEVDCAIFAIEAAEKRYENLIRAAKKSKIRLCEKNFKIF